MYKQATIYVKSLFNRSDFVRNVLILTSGTVFAQSLYFFTTPILSRIYSPENFGHFSVFVSIVSVVMIIATLTYEYAIVLPESDEVAVNLLSLTVLTSILTATVTFILIVGGFDRFGQLFNLSGYSYYLWLLPIGVLGAGLEQSFSLWFTRKNRFKLIASFQVLQSISVTFLMIIIGIIKIGPLGLIGGRVLGRIISLVYLCKNWWKGYGHLINQAVTIKEIKTQSRVYNKFLRYNFGAELINAFSQNIPILFLAYLYDATIVGLYGLAFKIVILPTMIVARSIQQVFYSKANETYRNKDSLQKLLKNTTVGMIKVWIMPFLILMLFGKIIFSVVFGHEWAMAGTYSQIIAPLFFFGVLIQPFVGCLFILELQKVKLYYEILLCISRFMSIYIGYIFWKSATISILLFGISGFLLNLAFVLFVFFLIKKRENFVQS
jgi:lipopolysaccharide exporter